MSPAWGSRALYHAADGPVLSQTFDLALHCRFKGIPRFRELGTSDWSTESTLHRVPRVIGAHGTHGRSAEIQEEGTSSRATKFKMHHRHGQKHQLDVMVTGTAFFTARGRRTKETPPPRHAGAYLPPSARTSYGRTLGRSGTEISSKGYSLVLGQRLQASQDRLPGGSDAESTEKKEQRSPTRWRT
jgi:hypothetical protein